MRDPQPDDPVIETEAERITSMGLRAILAEDYRTHHRAISRPGLQALWIHRLGVYATTLPKLFRLPLDILYVLGWRFCRAFYGIEMRRSANIGRRMQIAHQHGIVIHDYARFGDDCVIRQGVAFAVINEWDPGKGPVIGNKVSFGVGSVMIDNITIGDNVQIGPNCVISSDIPSDRTVFVAPPQGL
ncbi:MAG: serine acetyltransferase [Pseudomonadota bacterium]